ncbi:chorismate mutase 1, chloroplastic [Herrania umbratica]|uniref:chorismate mutase n=1 Tax=Herrania umbratica TaxID=108875 RepID=A0A6J1BKE0_9ROSI|nr:chorismate mutase 1, chloroplastic [Herrania umbratica]
MESKLLGQSFASILNQNAAKFATPKSPFTQRTTLKVVGSNFGANVSPSLRVSSPSSAISCRYSRRTCFQRSKGWMRVLHPCADSININDMILTVYFGDILPRLVRMGDDGNYGSSAVCDTICLQALSKRIQYGKFVAEAKFRESPTAFEAAIRAQDSSRLTELLTYVTVEAAVKKRVAMKTKAYAQELNQTDDTADADPVYKIQPYLVGYLYDNWIMPLTKKVQVEYLLRRLD